MVGQLKKIKGIKGKTKDFKREIKENEKENERGRMLWDNFPRKKINKLETKISNNTPETKINSQPNSSKVDWSSRRPPGYVFNKEFNKETATFVGPIFWEFRWNQKKRKVNERKIKENKRKIKGIQKHNKRKW